MVRIKPEIKKLYLVLFGMLFITGFLMINFKDPKFQNTGLYYTVLIIGTLVIYYFAPNIIGNNK